MLVLNLVVLENPSPYTAPFQFQISFECNETLVDGLELIIIYVGSAESEEFDPTLDSVLVGGAGKCMFIFQADVPSSSLLHESDALDVPLDLITCTYHGQEFISMGY